MAENRKIPCHDGAWHRKEKSWYKSKEYRAYLERKVHKKKIDQSCRGRKKKTGSVSGSPRIKNITGTETGEPAG